jgi:predicted transcriptional regulator
MPICPFCGAKYIEGVDECDECGQSLSDMSTPRSASGIERGLYKDRIRLLWPRKPVVVPPSTTVGEVLKLLVNNTIGCVMVVENEKVVGIFTERDALLKLNVEACNYGSRPISEFMTANPQTLSPDDKIVFAVQRMDLGGYRHVPLVDDTGALTGIISVRDILQYFMQKVSALSAPS